MKLFKYIAFLFIGMILFSSCEKSLEDINQDPTRLSDIEMRFMLPEVLTQTAFNQGNNTGRVAGLIMQQFRGLDAQQIQYGDNYLLGADVMNNYWGTGLYSGSLRAAQVLIDKATEEGAPFYSGVAKIMQANEYGLATSMFGDIPFSEALQGIDNLKPAYDTQQNVYAGVQALLDAGIADLQTGTGYAGGDLVYDGDVAKWIATAYAFKARYAMHLSKRDPSKASQDALSAIGNAFTSLADQPVFTFGTAQTDNWSLAKFGQERPSTLGFNQQFVDKMTANDDPRAANYYLVEGDVVSYWASGNTDLTWAQNDASIPLISLVELKMMEAEALVRTGGDGSAAFAAAIAASMAQVGVDATAAADYVTANGTLSGTMDEQIQQIVEEAYTSYYGYAFNSTWTNWRRTGYPVLTASSVASQSFDPSQVIPVRFLYVESEDQTNSVNVADARARQGGGLLDQPMWAFQ